MKNEKELEDFYIKKYPVFKASYPTTNPAGFENPRGLRKIIRQNSQHFGNFFNAYSKAYNKMYNRRGALFVDDFFRKEVSGQDYLQTLIHYIHYNPVHHGFVNDLRDWKHSSYETFFSTKTTSLKREKVIEFYNDIDNFTDFHKKDIKGFKPDFD